MTQYRIIAVTKDGKRHYTAQEKGVFGWNDLFHTRKIGTPRGTIKLDPREFSSIAEAEMHVLHYHQKRQPAQTYVAREFKL